LSQDRRRKLQNAGRLHVLRSAEERRVVKAAKGTAKRTRRFQVRQTIRRQLAAAVGKITARLEAAKGGQTPLGDGPEFSAGKIHYEIAERNHAITCGGIGAVHQLANKVGLVKALNTRLRVL
jgi:hypothetical protein